jgi:peptidoglycan/xylan/chitin deacetylase (PgdA/CDA1 family)/glycosyltransferase involved in cell wall biosynthesis
MKVLFLSNVFPNPYQPTKGIFNLRLVRALARDHAIEVISPVSWWDEWRAVRRGCTALDPARTASIEGIDATYPRYLYPPGILRRFYGWFMKWSIRTALEGGCQGRPDIVLAYWAHPDGEAAVYAARRMGVPAVVMVGGSDILLLARRGARRRCIENVMQLADAVITTGQDLRNRVIEMGVGPDKVHVAYRGVDTSVFAAGDKQEARRRLSVPLDLPVLLWVGRMVPVKGLEVLLAACSILHARGVLFRVYLVGDGAQRQALEKATVKLGLTEKVSFVGTLPADRLPDWYRAADLTVLPSHSEGVPNVLRESAACGTPFVASRVGDIPDLAEEGVDHLIPPGDAVSLAQAIMDGLNARHTPKMPRKRPADWPASAARVTGILEQVVLRSRQQQGCGVPSNARSLFQNGVQSPSWWRQRLRGLMTTVLPRRLFLVRGPQRCDSVCLTFDDGPHPEHTSRLLDTLKQLGARATFFIIGRNAQRYPDLLRRMAVEGHAIGNHSYSHGEPQRTSARELVEEARQTADLVAKIVGQGTRLFRPPHGKLTAAKAWRLWRTKQTIVLWNVDPKDFACKSAEELRTRFESSPLKGGDVVLLHDNHPWAAAVLPDVIAASRRRGLRFTTVTEWLQGSSASVVPEASIY